MFVPLKIKTEYSLLKSTIKIDTLIAYLIKHNITSCAICDDNLYGVMEFFTKMTNNQLKPIIGLSILIDSYEILLYPKNNEGYKNLLKIHTLKETKELNFESLNKYLGNIKIVLPRNSYDLLSKFPNAFLSYQNDTEKIEALLRTENCIYLKEARCLEKEDCLILKYLEAIDKGILAKEVAEIKEQAELNLHLKKEDEETTIEFIKDINLDIAKKGYYIPTYKKEVDSFSYLNNLAQKGLLKRCNGKITKEYQDKQLESIMTGLFSEDELYLESLLKSRCKTKMFMDFIDGILENYLKNKSNDKIEIRKRNILKHLYIEGMKQSEFIYKYYEVDRTFYSDKDRLLKDLAPYFFGIKGINI